MLTAQAGDPAAIQQKLNSMFKLTTTTADRTDIVTAGDVVVIHQPGVIMFGVGSAIGPTNVYKQGKIGQGLGTQMMMTGKDTLVRRFVPGEKCWVVQISVERDGVAFVLYSDPYSDNRYYGTLKVAFADKKTVPPVEEFLKTVAEVLTVDQPAEDQAGGAQPAPAGNGGSGSDPGVPVAGKYVKANSPNDFAVFAPTGAFSVSQGGMVYTGAYLLQGDVLIMTSAQFRAPLRCRLSGDTIIDPNGVVWKKEAEAAPVQAEAPAAPLPAIAPPPPPADAPPPTLAVGQTKEQVTAAFGQPLRIAKVGTKEIYYYKDMKVTFLSGKVSNVE